MQTITANEYLILKSKFQAGADGHRGRCEIDYIIYGPVDVGAEQDVALGGTATGTDNSALGAEVTAPANPSNILDGNDATYSLSNAGVSHMARAPKRIWTIDLGSAIELTKIKLRVGGNNISWYAAFQAAIGADLDPASVWARLEWSNDNSTWTVAAAAMTQAGTTPDVITFTLTAPETHRYWRTYVQGHYANRYYPGASIYYFQTIRLADVAQPDELGTATFPIKAASVEKNRAMDADSIDVEFENEILDMSLNGVVNVLMVPNNKVRLYEWHGVPANEILAFTGLMDEPGEDEPPRSAGFRARDMMKRAIEQTIQTIGPQGVDEKDKIRTTANYVYLNTEASVIINDLLDKIGWPTAEREISLTSFQVDEFLGSDGESHMAAMIDICTMTGYRIYADERGYAIFKPDGLTTAVNTDTAAVPEYTFRGDEDIVNLGARWSDYELRTRVRVVGPMTTTTNKAAWREMWHTNKFTKPVGIWHEPSDAGFIKVLDRGTKKVYRFRESDREKVGAGIWPLYIGGDVTYPMGLSGDPADATRFWVLEAAWRTGNGNAASVHKYNATTGAHLAEYALPDGQWTDLKVSDNYLILTNFGTDKVHLRSKADGSGVSNDTVVYKGVNQVNPTGVFVDGTTLGLFFYGYARFLLVDESAPASIDTTNALGLTDAVISTAGTKIIGGEINTATDEHLWACSDDLGLVWKFDLFTAVSTDKTVWEEVVDYDLEDDLGFRAQAQNRIHVGCPNNAAAHPYEIRRETIDLDIITSRAQARESAQRILAQVTKYTKTLDLGIVGNPALQKGDMIRVENLAAIPDGDWLLETYRDRMAGSDGTFLATMALVPWDPTY